MLSRLEIEQYGAHGVAARLDARHEMEIQVIESQKWGAEKRREEVRGRRQTL